MLPINQPLTNEAARKLMAMDVQDKEILTYEKLDEWYTAWGGKCYVSFSGGKDSTILVIEGGSHEEAYEDPDEAEKSVEAVISSIGTDWEVETFGYDVTRVLQIVTAEAGNDADQCRGIVQALFNACNRHRNRYTPEDVCRGYQYTTPASWVSDAALNAFCEVFVYGETFADIGNATVFYNPKIAGHSEYHEGQIYVCSIGDVKYFEEV